MDSSTIDDKPVSITPVPPNFDFNSQPAHQPMQNNNFFATGMAAFGDLFSGVGTVVAAEMDKAGKIIDSATDTGVLKTAKDQVGMAAQRTREIATDIDDKWHVRDNIINVAETGKSHATSVASVVANQTKQVAEQMDKSLHISENTGKLAEKARGNPTVNGGISAITGGFATLMAQTGLTASQTDANARSSAHSAPPREDSTAAPPADSQ